VAGAYPKLWLPINGLAAMVGFSRVYTGVHYPGDVLGGWIVGTSVAFVVYWAAERCGPAPTQID
jgi:undecaprenyl-diphosphatase